MYKVEKLNRELDVEDRMFRIAISESGNFVFCYDIHTGTLEFMNYNKNKLPIPEIVYKFPDNFSKYISKESINYKEIKRFLEEIEQGKTDLQGQIVIGNEEDSIYYQVQMANVSDKMQETIRIVGTLRDVTEEKQKEIELKKQAILDPLTKVYNRNAGMEKINKLLAGNKMQSNTFMLLDLDNFKTINDTLGHRVGDAVLVDVVNVIQKHVRSKDVVCRLGGDEFVVFLVDMPRNAIERNITSLLQKLNLVYERNGISEKLSASVGIVVTPEQGTEFNILYEKADIALYEVKNSQKNSYRFYQERE